MPIPPTQESVNALAGENIQSEAEMQAWYEKVRVTPEGGQPANGEEAALSRVGPFLYERIFKHYTKKQWDKCVRPAVPSSSTPVVRRPPSVAAQGGRGSAARSEQRRRAIAPRGAVRGRPCACARPLCSLKRNRTARRGSAATAPSSPTVL